jgi:predicted transcriptional regulator
VRHVMSTAAQRKVMTVGSVCDVLGAEVLCGDDRALGAEVQGAGAADLMSDVLALSQPGMLLLTGLVSVQVVRTAIVAELCGVVFVRGKVPTDEMIVLAKEARLPLLRTEHTLFEAAGLLYGALTCV